MLGFEQLAFSDLWVYNKFSSLLEKKAWLFIELESFAAQQRRRENCEFVLLDIIDDLLKFMSFFGKGGGEETA